MVTVFAAPKAGLAQVFSPGTFFTIGFFGLPVLAGGGISVAPAVRTEKVTDASGATTETTRTAIRYSGFLAMDVATLQL